jgi:cell division protein FtsL
VGSVTFVLAYILLTSLLALNEAHLQTQRNRLEMEAKCSRANNEKDRVEQRLSQSTSASGAEDL